MDDVKKTYREGEQTAKQAMRDADGNESVGDKLGNVGDELRKDVGNAGDDLDPNARGNAKAEWRKSDGDESLADKVGNAGDNIRDEMNERR